MIQKLLLPFKLFALFIVGFPIMMLVGNCLMVYWTLLGLYKIMRHLIATT